MPLGVLAQLVIQDNLNGASSSYPWQSFGGACLTAGNNTGSIPSCTSLGRIEVADPVGEGALRLTVNKKWDAGWLVSKFTLPSDVGLEVTWTSVAYDGDDFAGHGADGLSFFLIDASRVGAVDATLRLGAGGGSLGYASQHHPKKEILGLQGGYIGVGIDESGYYSIGKYVGTGGSVRARPNAVVVRGSENTGYKYLGGSWVPEKLAASKIQLRAKAPPTTFNLRLTRDAKLNLSYSRNGGAMRPVLSDFPITESNGALPDRFYFGFAGTTGGGTNVHEILCFKAAGAASSGSSVQSNAQDSGRVQQGTQLYLAYHHSNPWWGQLTAQDLVLDPVTKKVSIRAVANWDASCALTGGICDATGKPVVKLASYDRTVLTWDGARGVPFHWRFLPEAHRSALRRGEAGDSMATMRMIYLRGGRDMEGKQSTDMRTRKSVLGDIVNSSPTWVGPARMPYTQPWNDALYPQAAMPEGSSYADFAAHTATRTNVVYVGSNDGMLHGFRAGAYKAQGAFDSTAANDGKELLAYMPMASVLSLVSTEPQLDYTSQHYAHNAFVDATPGVGDLYYGNAWHTWLVSGLGGGGNPGGVLGDNNSVASGTVFALDVTDPAQFTDAHAASVVVGEWRSDTIQCLGDTPSVRCGDSLGSTYGTPVIRRLHDGNWAAIFGNGFHSKTGTAGVFILHVNAASGARTFRYLDTGSGSPGKRNGIAYVTPVDLDGDNVVDYLYAGDLAGSVWRFELTSSDPAKWRVRAQPVFQTGGLPITTAVLATPVAASDHGARLMLNFGTGQVQPQTLSAASQPHSSPQYLFGVWDWDHEPWNDLSHHRLRSLSSSPAGPVAGPLTRAHLQAQTIRTHSDVLSPGFHGVRTVTRHPVCWHGETLCKKPRTNDQFGWYAPLPVHLEQVAYNPALLDGLFVVSTVIPAIASPLSCTVASPASGYTMALTPDQGIAPTRTYFGDTTRCHAQRGVVVGVSLNAVGTPMRIVADGVVYLVTQTSNGSPTLTAVNPKHTDITLKRLTWRRIR